MSKNTLRVFELAALWSIAIGALACAAYMAKLGHFGGDFAALLLVITTVVNRISNLSQSQAMQTMADHLARSSPPQDPNS